MSATVLDWDVNLVLKAAEVPRTALGAAAALGHTTWVGSRRDTARDADDLYLTPPSQTTARAGRWQDIRGDRNE